MELLIIFMLGLLCGWAIKSPFLVKYYKKIKKDKEHIKMLLNNFNAIYKKEDIPTLDRQKNPR
jgi:uncharacterized membrane protein YciS (DUF1049 family)